MNSRRTGKRSASGPEPIPPSSMRILQVIPSMDPRQGGMVEAVRQLHGTPTMRPHRMEVVCLDDPASEWLNKPPLTTPSQGSLDSSSTTAPDCSEQASLLVHALGAGRGVYRYRAGFV